ncbi:MAG: Csu type fimbrial protein [Stenotrophomonas sp.]|uniref:Csu type fimbrial protein n=1 Tax=Stenotrophomonas sp. TaxID=69392 RepID=UPI003D6D6B5F
MALMAPLAARATPSCKPTLHTSLNFGAVPSDDYRDAETFVEFECNGPSGVFASQANFRACLFINEGSDPPGVNPRRMKDGLGNYLDYDLYSDRQRSSLIGPLGSSAPTHSVTFAVLPRDNRWMTLPIYGRVRAAQNQPATSTYSGVPGATVVRYSYAFLSTPTEDDCRNGVAPWGGGKGSVNIAWGRVYVNVENACSIITATDMDFGTVGTEADAQDQTSLIKVQCPTGAPWTVTLDNGANATGDKRFMASGQNRLGYELYSDAARRKRWGNTATTGIKGSGTNKPHDLTVYGRIPDLSEAPPGSYQDQITVTLTY